MTELLQYLIPIIAMALLAAGWGAVQLLAKKMKTKNHIDNGGGCCGACSNREACERKLT